MTKSPRLPAPLLLPELATALKQRPAAIVAGAGVSIALSGNSIAYWNGFLADGLDLARKESVISDEQHRRHLGATQSGDAAESVAVGRFIEAKLRRDRPEAFARWLRDTLGSLTIKNPELGQRFADARRQGLVLATTNFDPLLSHATGLRPVTWSNPEFDALVTGDPVRLDSILHLDGFAAEPASIVFGDRASSDESLYRERLAAFVGPLRFILLVGIGGGFFASGLLQALRKRRDSLPGAILCREQDVAFFQERLADSLPWIRPAPYPGDFDALPAALASVLEHSTRTETPPSPKVPEAPPTLPLPDEFLELVESPPRFASFLARLVLENREAMDLVETLDPARLLGALRQAAATTTPMPSEQASQSPAPEAPDPQRILDLERRLGTDFQPPPLWLAWIEHCRGPQLRTLAERLKDMALQPATTATTPGEPRRAPPSAVLPSAALDANRVRHPHQADPANPSHRSDKSEAPAKPPPDPRRSRTRAPSKGSPKRAK